MKKEIDLLFVRHAQSNGNLGITENGFHKDDPRLSAEGESQAKKLAQSFSDGQLDAIYSISLIRACQTVEPTAEKLGIRVRVLRELMEVGTSIANTPPMLAEKYAPNSYESLKTLNEQKPVFDPSDETDPVCEKRAAFCINKITGAAEDGDRILICSHGAFLGYLIRCSLGLSLPEKFNWEIDNCGVFHIRINKGSIPTLVSSNNRIHLNTVEEE